MKGVLTFAGCMFTYYATAIEAWRQFRKGKLLIPALLATVSSVVGLCTAAMSTTAIMDTAFGSGKEKEEQE